MEHLDSVINRYKGKTCFDLEARIVFSPVSHRLKTPSESYIIVITHFECVGQDAMKESIGSNLVMTPISTANYKWQCYSDQLPPASYTAT